MWSYAYPNNVNAVFGERPAGYAGKLITETDPWPIFEGYGTYLSPNVYPTPFYETVMATIIFAILWSLRKKIAVPGKLFALYMIFNGVERFLIEKIRVNAELNWAGLTFTQAELISTVTFISGVILWFFLSRKQVD
jgi:prolipoprotein diacylglyceryltransferase